MPRYYFDICENHHFVRDDDGQDFADQNAARQEAIETVASIAGEGFARSGSRQVIINVREGGAPFLKVSITLYVEET
jgi:hypothetical protein